MCHLLTTNGFVVHFWAKSELPRAWPKTHIPSMMLPSFGNANTAVCRPRQVRAAVARGRKRVGVREGSPVMAAALRATRWPRSRAL